MKYYLSFIIIFCALTFGIAGSVFGSERLNNTLVSYFQQEPFYFLNEIPPAIKMPGSIDLSFFKNRMVVFMYRYRLQIPDALETAIDRSVIVWSPWLRDDYSEIKIPRLDLEGGHKLIVEYKEIESDETKTFEVPFYVYRMNLITYSADIGERQILDDERIKTETGTETNRVTTQKAPVPERTQERKVAESAGASIDNRSVEKKPIEKKETPVIEKVIYETSKVFVVPSDVVEQQIDTMILLASYSESPALFSNDKDENIVPESGITAETSDHKPADTLVTPGEDTDIFSLHAAIISGKKEYTRALINKGADLNRKNNLELSPLHLAVLLNNKESVKDLIDAGAEINIKGNMGYIPLHIASELNYTDIAATLLLNGADCKIKTDQGFSSREIAKIQKNLEMLELLNSKDISSLNHTVSNNMTLNNFDVQSQDFTFNLSYDDKLVNKKRFLKIFRIISIPAFAISAVSTTYLKSEANKYYSLSKVAETEEMARFYFDKTSSYDTYAYISGAVSLTSVFGIIYSTIRKKNVTKQMYKNF